ncbi:AAA family ATPase [Nocardioides alcanivorans]|uniref:AAA family ATPase n=1 Tax=Nocardioides alcanivorans TaxID=2897352 RepID=UPI001F3F3B00|nr:AAA family ATPase [Nocardioides alcanivorans]
MLGPDDTLPCKPGRILVAGTSGSGKSTLARKLSRLLDVPYTEIDALFHGADWTPRAEFLAEVEALAGGESWITEYQYGAARPILLERCDLVVHLLLNRRVVMRRVVARTVRRSLRREVLWNGNVEPPFWTIFGDRDHIIRWAWRTHRLGPGRLAHVAAARPDLPVVVLRSPDEIRRWTATVSETRWW